MTKKEGKGKTKEKRHTVEETVSARDVMKRMRVIIPKDLKEPETPGPKKKPKQEKRE